LLPARSARPAGTTDLQPTVPLGKHPRGGVSARAPPAWDGGGATVAAALLPSTRWTA